MEGVAADESAPRVDPQGAGSPQIELEGLTKRYDRKVVLAQVSLEVDPGSFTVLLGPSGSGKSTLLRCVAGIERVTAGTIRFDGELMAGSEAHVAAERRGLAMVFQDYALWPHMTTSENVAFALKRLRIPRSEVSARVGAMLERVGLGALADRYPSDLSGGEQQRVALARAMVAEPGLLLFDEPLSNLDADLRERLRVEIATLTRETGCTVVYITHDQSEAFALADRIGVLEAGHLVQYSTPEELYVRPATAFVARFTGLAGEVPCRVHGRAGDERVTIEVDGHRIPGREASGFAVAAGSSARVLVRAGAVRLGPSGSVGSESGGDIGVVPAVIRDVAFRGRGYDHVVELPGRHRLIGIFHPLRHERGTNVNLHLDAGGCIVFPEHHVADSGVPSGTGADTTDGPTVRGAGPAQGGSGDGPARREVA
jgi:ABC-type Fe3+/spermidine/putrescine transport system ATPase subunit